MTSLNCELKLQALGQYFREGWDERMRLTRPRSKKRAFKEGGPMDCAVAKRLIRQGDFGLAMRLGQGIMVVAKDGPNVGPFAQVTSVMTAIGSRGTHEFFRTDMDGATNKIKAGGYDVDLLFNGIVCLPPSEMSTGKIREWKTGTIPLGTLPVFPRELCEQVGCGTQRGVPRRIVVHSTDEMVEAMRQSIRRIYAVEGTGGDRQTFRVALKIVSVIPNDFERALSELMAWNAEGFAKPAWTDMKALEHKIRSAMKYITERGQACLL